MKKLAVLAVFVFSMLLTFSFAVYAQEEAPAETAPAAEAAPAVYEAPAIVGNTAQRFDIKDVYGRIFPADQFKDWVIVYGFGNEDNANEGLEIIDKLAMEEPGTDGLLYVIVADTSKYSSKILQPFAKKILKKEFDKKLADLEKKLAESNIDPGFEIRNRYLLVADFSGDIYDLFSIGARKSELHFFVVDGKHKVRTHYNAYSDKVPSDLRLVLAERETEEQFASLTSQKRKKKMWIRYAIGGALLYVLLK